MPPCAVSLQRSAVACCAPNMPPNNGGLLLDKLAGPLGYSRKCVGLVSEKKLCSLWAGYGTVSEIIVKDSESNTRSTVIVKRVSPPAGSGVGHERKLKSYEARHKFSRFVRLPVHFLWIPWIGVHGSDLTHIYIWLAKVVNVNECHRWSASSISGWHKAFSQTVLSAPSQHHFSRNRQASRVADPSYWLLQTFGHSSQGL